MHKKIQVYKATLIKRYKRFLADIILSDGSITTIHLANTGGMHGCANAGDTVWYSISDNSKRKYPYSWELTEKPNGDLICVNTQRANEFIEYAIKASQIANFQEYSHIQREVKYGTENSRIDFVLSSKSHPKLYAEVKSVTLLENNQGYFPDAKTIRGQKHLRELIQLSKNGTNTVLIFAVMHTGIKSVKIADHIDKAYYDLFEEATDAGVNCITNFVQFNQYYNYN